MRTITILWVLAVGVGGGCAGNGGSRRTAAAAPPRDIPVVSERPSVFERQRVNHQRQSEQEMLGLTHVWGDVTR